MFDAAVKTSISEELPFPYNAAGLTCVANNTTCFLSPQYRITGGGASDFDYNSNSVANGLGALTDYVKGVAEK